MSTSYLRALSAEVAKYRRTAALFLTFGIPLLIVALAWAILTQSNLAQASEDRKWIFLLGITAQTWVTTCLPIGGAILIGMLWGIEHSSNQLKHVLAQPPSRHAFFWAKTTGIFTLIALGTAALTLLTAALATVVGIGPVRWDIAAAMPFRALLGSLPALAFVSWLAQRFSSFALPLIVGVAGLVIGAIAANSDQYWHLVPWAWGVVAAMGDDAAQRDSALLLGGSFGVLTLLASSIHFWRADTAN